MPSISRKALSAIEALVYIACKPGTEPVCSKEVSEYQGVAVRYLEPIMQELVHKKILRGVRGPKGGYLLARERKKINLQEIVHVVESFETKKKAGASELFKHVVSPIWKEANKETLSRLEHLTIQDLCDKAREFSVFSGVKKSDFTI